jgi:UDP-2,3-diacylglucosamine hydrolase
MTEAAHTLFIADLHLDPSRPQITALFLEFLRTQARQADALYILGDLFEVWIGDDDDAPLALQVAAGLHRLRASGVPVYFMHGNRDFLLGAAYAYRAGLNLLPELTVIDLYGRPTVLLHGDTLCTDDTDYLAFRAKVRDPAWQRRVLWLPRFLRRFQADRMRAASQQATGQKSATITDVNEATVLDCLRHHGVQRMIHGHTHRPAIHRFALEEQPAERIVLGDWIEHGSVLVCTAASRQLHTVN